MLLSMGILLIASTLHAADPKGAFPALDKDLRRIFTKHNQTADLEKLEGEYRTLIPTHSSPEEKGKIFAQIARTYGQRRDAYHDQVTRAANQALSFPLSSDDQLDMYAELESCIQYENLDRMQKRDRWADIHLQELKVVLDNLTISSPQTSAPPQHFQLRCRPGTKSCDDAAEQVRRLEQAQYKKEAEIREQNKLLELRSGLIHSFDTDYSSAPSDLAALRSRAAMVLSTRHSSAIEEIISAVKVSRPVIMQPEHSP